MQQKGKETRPCFAFVSPVAAAKPSAHCRRRPKGSHTVFSLGENDEGELISKVRVCAIVSGHPKCSKDRSLRVRTMSAKQDDLDAGCEFDISVL